MTTIKSSFDLTRTFKVYKSVVRRYLGLGMLYAFLSLIALPLQYLLNMLSSNHIMPKDGLIGPSLAYNGVSVFFFFLLMFIMPLVLGSAMTGFMQQKRSVDVYHSLPVTRSELLTATIAAAATILFIPLFFSFALVAVMAAVNIGSLAVMPLVYEALCWAACSFAIFSLSVFAAVNVGTVFDGTVFAIALNGILAVIALINTALASIFLFGYNASEKAIMFALKLSPISVIAVRQALYRNNIENYAKELAENNLVCVLWTLAALAICVWSVVIYQKRKSESAEQVGNYGALSVFIRVAGYYIVSVAMGMIFFGVLDGEEENPFVLFTIGSLVGVLVAYLVIEVILSRGLKTIIKRLPLCIAAALFMVAISTGLSGDGFGYETKLPDLNTVDSVTINYNGRYKGAGGSVDTVIIKDSAAIASIIEAQRSIIETRNKQNADDNASYYRYSNITLSYAMENGSTMERAYHSRIPDGATTALASLETNDNFIEQVHPVFSLDISKMQGINIIDILNENTTYKVLSSEDNVRLVEALKADLKAATFESIAHPDGPALGYIQILYEDSNKSITAEQIEQASQEKNYPSSIEKLNNQKNAQTYVLIDKGFSNTISFLKEKGLYELIMADTTGITSAMIFNDLQDVSYSSSVVWQSDPDNFERVSASYPKKSVDETYLSTDDPELIVYLLKNSVSSRLYDEKMCTVVFKMAEDKEGYAYFYIPLAKLPETLKSQAVQEKYFLY